jgi:hypothetical protein
VPLTVAPQCCRAQLIRPWRAPRAVISEMSVASALPGQHSESTNNKPIRVNLMSHSLRQAGANRVARGGAVLFSGLTAHHEFVPYRALLEDARQRWRGAGSKVRLGANPRGLNVLVSLRAYDACQAGDEQDAKAILARLLGQSGERGAPSQERRAAAETRRRS